MTKKLLATAFLTASLALAACNTIAGVGRDVQSAGKTVAECAEGDIC